VHNVQEEVDKLSKENDDVRIEIAKFKAMVSACFQLWFDILETTGENLVALHYAAAVV
jgi:hypothetical protein